MSFLLRLGWLTCGRATKHHKRSELQSVGAENTAMTQPSSMEGLKVSRTVGTLAGGLRNLLRCDGSSHWGGSNRITLDWSRHYVNLSTIHYHAPIHQH